MSTYPFGRDKGKDLKEVGTESLMYLIGRCDQNDPKYGAKNRLLVQECNDIINSRSDSGYKKPQKATKSGPVSAQITVDMAALSRIEKKLDSVITHLGLDKVDEDDSLETGNPLE
jgi:hypothetical protein